ncbi:EthD domain-containing protein [Actinoplanes sp. NPDC049265]|uniref:EthD domain-containing protein n=1 Tax=Actinoplanes sp. NPDC049265 TaxID=3363902 RepID=UPI003715B117
MGGKNMIKASVHLFRRPDLSPDEFVSYWRDTHAPLLRSLPDFTSRVRRYTQQYRLGDLPPGLPLLGCDGVAEIWLDNPVDVIDMFQSVAYQQTVAADEENFLDRSKTELLLTTEQSIVE